MSQPFQYPPPNQPIMIVQAVPPTSELAVISLIASIVWLCGVGSVVALICGFLALGQTKDGRRGGHGMAVAGIVIGAIGLFPTAFLFMAMVIGSAASTPSL